VLTRAARRAFQHPAAPPSRFTGERPRLADLPFSLDTRERTIVLTSQRPNHRLGDF